MPQHPVRSIEYHILQDNGGYSDHPNPNRKDVVPVKAGMLEGRAEVKAPMAKDKETTAKKYSPTSHTKGIS